MHELALYRKYRPNSFSEVIGQDHVVSVLESSIKTHKVSHAYLFVGGRGTGKTSVARIFAKAIGVSNNDLYEMDAASNRGIDEIRSLRDGVRVLPFDSKYKVYIIDEVHMLTKEAWGALLKTLEEPPEHVIFILATTELHKVPDTIISRCQMFSFKKASDASVKKVLVNVSKEEGFELNAGAADLLAILGDGSYRNALGELQKILNHAGKNKKITREDVEKITGAPTNILVNDFLEAIAKKDLDMGLKAVRRGADAGLDMELYLKLIISKFRLAIILKYSPKLKEEMQGDIGDSDVAFLEGLVKEDKTGMLRSPQLSVLLEAYQNLNNAFISELPLELALVKILGQDE